MEWREAAELFADSPGRAVVIGAVDTGKTTFCAELLRSAAEGGGTAALIDCDVGQSTLGPPATIGAKVFAAKSEIGPDLFAPFLWFVGATSPENRIIQAVAGASAAARWIEESGRCPIVVDTTGLVGGDKARRLKACKIEAVKADVVFGLQRQGEIEHILSPLEAQSLKVIRVECPPGVVCRSADARRRYRAERLRDYFARHETLDICVDEVAVYECPADLAGVFPAGNVLTFQTPIGRSEVTDLLVGLGGRGRHTIAVGRVLSFEKESRILRTAVPRLLDDDVTFVEFANLAVEDVW